MISMVIPTYTLDEELEEMAIICALTYREEVDQLIITEDGGNYSQELRKIADIYIYNKVNEGFTKNVNKGWKLATEDYCMIVNSDTQFYTGKLKDLCIPGKVTCPITHTENVPFFWGAFWCTPKNIRDEYGLLNENILNGQGQYDKNFGSDSEYEKRIGHIYQPVQTVEIIHQLNQTWKKAGLTHP